MPTYALLGATGQVGNSILKVLLQQYQTNQDIKINAYCRSKSKLANQFPELQSNDPPVSIFPGAISDTNILTDCCRGTQAIFLAVAAIQNEPGCSIAQDASRAVVAALERLRDEGTRVPRLVVLSSASTEAKFCEGKPWPAHNILHAALSSLYIDLEKAEVYLRSHSDWVDCVFVKPGALSHDVQGGHALSFTKSASPVSFLDLAAGMVEVAAGGEEFAGKSVSVLPTGGKVAFPWDAPLALVKGLLLHFFPWLWGWI